MNKENEDLGQANEITQKNETDPFSKLKRLKMQEQLMLNHHNLTLVLKEFNDVGSSTLNRKIYSNNLKKRYFEIRSLYEDIRHNVSSEEKLQLTDIENIKKDVFHLEHTILSYKKYLQRELTTLKEIQGELYDKMCNEDNNHFSLKETKKVKIIPFSNTVPSPVKAIINTPHKIEEVQLHEDFLRKHGACGGWNEVYHNIFIKICQKYNSNGSSDDEQYIVNELIQKLPGCTSDDIIKHIDWYKTSQILKNDKQLALQRWRESKNILKLQYTANNEEHSKAKTTKRSNVHKEKKDMETSASSGIEDHANQDNKAWKSRNKNSQGAIKNVTDQQHGESSRRWLRTDEKMYMQPTEQWINRSTNCSECGTFNVHNMSINNISKL